MSECDETMKICGKTWDRTVDSINKVGYSDGVVAGQTASFQFSFDTGYKQGFKFGFDLGFKKADKLDINKDGEDKLFDPRKINCQICVNNNTISENVVNLYNRQHEQNNNYFVNK